MTLTFWVNTVQQSGGVWALYDRNVYESESAANYVAQHPLVVAREVSVTVPDGAQEAP